jgi:hypothetical protein
MTLKLLAPDVLELTRSLTPLVSGSVFGVGLFLWVLGAASHRFWLVLLVTLAAGVAGLQVGPYYDIQPLVAGLLFALAAGAMALSLVRVMLFLMGGVMVLALMRGLNIAWNEPFLFVCGGLSGVLLYRWWMTVMSAFVGSLFMIYAGLSLADHLGYLQCVPWADRNAGLLNWGVVLLTVVGVLVQFLLTRRRKSKDGKPGKSAGKAPKPDKPKKPVELEEAHAARSWARIPRIQFVWPNKH